MGKTFNMDGSCDRTAKFLNWHKLCKLFAPHQPPSVFAPSCAKVSKLAVLSFQFHCQIRPKFCNSPLHSPFG